MQMGLDLFPKCAGTFKAMEKERFGVEPNLECDRVDVCCWKVPDWPETVSRAGTYVFRTARDIAKIPALPKIVYAIEGNQGHRPFMRSVGDRTWAVKFQSAVAGDLGDCNRVVQWRIRQGIPTNKRLILHQETNDEELERFYKKTHHPNFFSILRASPNCVFISPGYSVYDDGSMRRHHQLLNLKRSIDFFVRASDNGLLCIPCLGWNLQQDLDRIAQWGNEQPSLRHIAINCQTLRQRQYPNLCREMTWIEQASRKIHWVVFGGVRAVYHLRRGGFTDRMTLITAAPIQYAKAGHAIDRNFRSSDKVKLFKHNRKTIQAYFDGLR